MNRIQEIRNQFKTQREMALALGVTQPFISMCMSGKRNMNPALVKTAEKLTGIPREEIRPDIFGK